MNATALAARVVEDLRGRLRRALALHLVMQLLGVAIFTPFLTWIGRHLVLASGEPVISNFDIAAFVLSPGGALSVALLAAIALGLLFAELAGLSFIAGRAIAREPVTHAATLAFVLRKLPVLIALAGRVLLRLLLLALPFAAAGAAVWFALLAEHDINYYLAERPTEWQRAVLLLATIGALSALVAVWQLARWIYAVPILVLRGGLPRHALADSARLTRGRLPSIVTPLVLWWLLWSAFAVLVLWVAREISDAGLAWAGLDIKRVLPLVAFFVVAALVGGFLYSGVHLAGHQFLTTRMYVEEAGLGDRAAVAVPEQDLRIRHVVLRAFIAVSILFVGAVGAGWFVASRLDLESDVAVTAHRGASIVAPENSIAAFRAALEAGATYAELDVQRTRDGAIVVVHDGDLLRLGDDARKIGALTVDDLRTIDIGSKFAPSFATERVPLLEDVIALARGRMRINVELKYNVPDPGLAAAVIDLLRRERFLDQVVITSLDYAALQEVERIEPGLMTGHIVTAAVGDVVRTEADFLSLNAARATPFLIRRAHAAGKTVHVWTVNTPETMVRMIERGVDNIITDDPKLLAEVMRERRTLSRAELLGLRLRVLFSKAPPELRDPDAVTPL